MKSKTNKNKKRTRERERERGGGGVGSPWKKNSGAVWHFGAEVWVDYKNSRQCRILFNSHHGSGFFTGEISPEIFLKKKEKKKWFWRFSVPC
jgi:hypothetical protein